MEQPYRIMVVDDEEQSRQVIAEMVESLGYEVETFSDGFEALAAVKLDFDLVLSDAKMPGMDGFDLVNRLKTDEKYKDIPVAMVTGLNSKDDRLRAADAGADDFLGKPVRRVELRVRLRSLLRTKKARDELKEQRDQLEAKVRERTQDLRNSLRQMAEARRVAHEAHLETLHRLAVAAEYRDECTGAHVTRVGEFCGLLAEKLHLAPGEIEIIRGAGPIHDVGKIGIPDSILLKPGKLTAEEWSKMESHTTIGARILAGSESDVLRTGEVIARTHHEKWDGSGYPAGLKGDDIPLYGRICAVADVFDALTSDRPYREALDPDEAVEIMEAGRGSHFDPHLLDVFVDNKSEVFDIYEEYRDEPELAERAPSYASK